MSSRLYASSGSRTGVGVSKVRSARGNLVPSAPDIPTESRELVRPWTVGFCAPAASARSAPLANLDTAERRDERADRRSQDRKAALNRCGRAASKREAQSGRPGLKSSLP